MTYAMSEVEQLAEEYVRVNCDDSLYSFRGQELAQAYLAGFKAGREEQGERMKEIAKEYTDFGKVKRTERGWAGHFCCSDSCKFRRNTLLEYNGNAIVVSTVGAMVNSKGDLEEIGLGRHYETMAFYADDSEYKDAKVSEEIFFDSPWSLKWHKEGYIDNEANAMHEKVVEELSEKLLKGEL